MVATFVDWCECTYPHTSVWIRINFSVLNSNCWHLYLVNDRLQNYTELETEDDFMIEDKGELIIGQDQDCLLGCFDEPQALTGDLDDFSVWDSALTLADVQKMYQDGFPSIENTPKVTLAPSSCEKHGRIHFQSGKHRVGRWQIHFYHSFKFGVSGTTGASVRLHVKRELVRASETVTATSARETLVNWRNANRAHALPRLTSVASLSGVSLPAHRPSSRRHSTPSPRPCVHLSN